MATKITDTSVDTIDVTEVLATPVVEAPAPTPAPEVFSGSNAVADLEKTIAALGKQDQFAKLMAVLKAKK